MTKYTGYKFLWKNYSKKNLWKGTWRALLCSIPAILALSFTEKPFYESIGEISNLIISSFPSLIGFILAGYAVLIGCSGTDLIKPLCKLNEKSDISHFQNISATFAVVMIGLISTFLIGFLVSIVYKAEVYFWFASGYSVFNALIVFILTYMAIYSIWSLCDITVNVFNFSQYINYENQPKEKDRKSDASSKESYGSVLKDEY